MTWVIFYKAKAGDWRQIVSYVEKAADEAREHLNNSRRVNPDVEYELRKVTTIQERVDV